MKTAFYVVCVSVSVCVLKLYPKWCKEGEVNSNQESLGEFEGASCSRCWQMGMTLAGSHGVRKRKFPVCGYSVGCVCSIIRDHKGGKRNESQGVGGTWTLSAFQGFWGGSVFLDNVFRIVNDNWLKGWTVKLYLHCQPWLNTDGFQMMFISYLQVGQCPPGVL